MFRVMTAMPARLALAMEGASATEFDRLQEDDRGALIDQRIHQARLHFDLVLAVEQFVVDDLLRLQHLLDPL